MFPPAYHLGSAWGLGSGAWIWGLFVALEAFVLAAQTFLARHTRAASHVQHHLHRDSMLRGPVVDLDDLVEALVGQGEEAEVWVSSSLAWDWEPLVGSWSRHRSSYGECRRT